MLNRLPAALVAIALVALCIAGIVSDFDFGPTPAPAVPHVEDAAPLPDAVSPAADVSPAVDATPCC